MRRFALSVAAAVVLTACGGDSTFPLATSTIPPGPYTPGQSYFGRNNYIEYIAGNAPVILSAPHGGNMAPAEIPDRTDAACGGSATTVTDINTIELVKAMQQRYFARYGRYPHVIISHLARRKLDPNRLLTEAACGNSAAQTAYAEWHAFIDAAKSAAVNAGGKAWYMDMHGHGHAVQRLELGYLLTPSQLNASDNVLTASSGARDSSSIRTIAQGAAVPFVVVLRGDASLGSLYAVAGFPAVPSASDPRPNSDPYFDGGENTRRHTCGTFSTAPAGMVCGIQIESNYMGVRDTQANRDRFGDATAQVLGQFLQQYWGLRL